MRKQLGIHPFCLALTVSGAFASVAQAESRSEKNLRKSLKTIVASAEQNETTPDNGLKLSLKIDDGAAPADLSYSIERSALTPESANEGRDGIQPGVYQIKVKEGQKEVFSRFFLALHDVASSLELHYANKQFSLRQTLALPQVKFVPNQKRVDKKSRKTIEEIASLLKSYDAIELFEVEVHTDANGNEAKNQELTEQRAIELRNELVKKGVDPQRLKAEGFGSTKPVADNGDKAGRLLNRRTEYVIVETAEQPRLLGTR